MRERGQLLNLRLGYLAVSDVGQAARSAQHRAVAVQRPLGIDFHPAHLSVLGQKPGFVPAIIQFLFDELNKDVPVLASILLVNEFQEKGTQRRIHLEARNRRPSGTQESPVPKPVELENDFTDVLNDGTVPDFARVQRGR